LQKRPWTLPSCRYSISPPHFSHRSVAMAYLD
jgi:hypothetical protein